MELVKYQPKNNQTTGVFLVRTNSSDIKSVDEVWVKKVYQRPTLPFIIETNDRWVDLGANIGAFTVYCALKGGTVIAYEPQVDNVELIEKNVHINNVANRVQVKKLAVVPDSQDGKVLNFYVSTNPASFRRHTLYGNYLNSAKKKHTQITCVNAIGFSKVLNDGFDCIKMNIEGAEIPIIMELQSGAGIKKMVFEYSFDMDKRILTFVAVIDKLKKIFKTVKPARKIPLHLETYPFYPPNCYIFCSNV